MCMKYPFIVILSFLNCYLAAQSLSFEEVNLEQDTDNALRVNANVITSEPAHVYAQYTYVKNGESYTETSPLSNFQKEHELNLIALRDSTLYEFRIFAFNKQNQVQSQLYEIITPKLPLSIENFNEPRVNQLDNQQTYTLTNSVRGGESYFFICDAEGRLVWYQDYRTVHNVCNGWRWTEEQTILQADCKTIREMDLQGNVITEIKIDQPEWNMHHDVMKLRDGNIMAIYTKPEKADLSQTVGDPDATVAVDGYIIVNKEGEILDNWSTSDHFDIQKAERKGAYWNVVYGSGTIDWCHFNALEEDIDGSILISVSHWSRILKIDRASGELIWQLGEGGDLRVPPGFTFRQQHAITTLAPNRYLIFDNLGLQESSRVIEFAVETNEGRAFSFWEYVPQPNIVCITRGNTQRLDNGNTLIFFPTSQGFIQEVDSKGQLLWDVSIAQRSGYRAYRIAYINAPHAPVSFVGVPDSVCANAAPFEIITEPAEAYLFGEAIEDGMFIPQKVNKGLNKVYATYGTSIQEIEIDVLEIPEQLITTDDKQILSIEDTFENYQWYLNEDLIDEATNAQYQPEESGLFYVTATNAKGCTIYSDTLNFTFVDAPVNFITGVELTQWKDYLMIESEHSQNLSIDVFNVQGQKLFDAQGENRYQIPAKILPAIYLVRIFDGQDFMVRKMLRVGLH